MKNFRKILLMTTVILVCATFFVTAGAAPAKTVLTEKAGETNTVSSYDAVKNYASVMGTYIFDNGDGTLCVLDAETDEVIADTYDSDTFELIGTKSIQYELDKFGGAYSGKEYNFIVFGQINGDEDDNLTTFKTVKYSKSWEKLDEADYKDNNTTVPFDAGSLRMAEHNGYLYIRSAHEMYTSSDGLNHQANITYSVDINSMTIADEFSTVWNIDGGYVSHSFNQFIIIDEGQLVAVDHGDAYPRSIVLGKYDSKLTGGRFSGNYSHINLLDIPGGIGDNYTGVSVGGFEASEDTYITAINCVDFDSIDENSRDILLLIAEKSKTVADDVEHICLTNYAGTGKVGSAPYLVKINDNKFAVLWTEFEDHTDNGVRYVYVDAKGRKLSDILSFDNAVLSAECQPIVVDGNIVWFANTRDGRKFCVINTDGKDIGESTDLSKPAVADTPDTSDEPETTPDIGEEKSITVWLDGNKLEFDVEPIIENGRTLVPMRVIFEALGADVAWDNNTQTAIAIRDKIVITITIDQNIMIRNAEAILLDVPARLINSRTLVPVRAVSEGLNANVDWIDSEKKVIITTKS